MLQRLEKFDDKKSLHVTSQDPRGEKMIMHVKEYIKSHANDFLQKPQFIDHTRPAMLFYREYLKGTFINYPGKAALVSQDGTIRVIPYEESSSGEKILSRILSRDPKCDFIMPCRGFFLSNYLTVYDEEDEKYADASYLIAMNYDVRVDLTLCFNIATEGS